MKPFAALAGVALFALAACTTQPDLTEGRKLMAEGRFEEGLARLEQAAKTQPRNAEAYAAYITQRDGIVNAYVRDADGLRTAGNLDAAEAQYRQALRMNPDAPLARAGLDIVARLRRHQLQMGEAEQMLKRGDAAGAERLARAVLAEDSSNRTARAVMKGVTDRRTAAEATPPRLRNALQRQVTIELRDAPLRTIFDIISRTGEINFILDRDVKTDARTTILVRDTSLDDVLRVVLLTNQLDRKFLNDNSVLIYPATQAKQREYQELQVRSFYLANADVKQTAAMIRALVKTRDLFVDEKLNLIIMRDTPDAIRLAEQLVATQDLGEPEVMLEVEVLEVASSLVQEVGFRFPEQVSVVGTDPAGVITNPFEIRSSGFRVMTSNPVLLLNLRRLDGSTNLLANPRIRVKNREKAKIHIGERVPVITTTSTANVGVSSSVSYLETGLKLDVEPNIFLEDEVAIKVSLEVSNILEQLQVQGTVAYRLGTRNAATVLRLKDGETQVLAGLINSEDRKSFAKVPFVSEVPVLGRLFRNDDTNAVKTEIVLLITPRIVHNVARPDTVQSQFPSGTEAVPGATPLRLSNPTSRIGMAPDASGPSPIAAAAARPAPAQVPAIPMNVIAPSQATVGGEFAISFALPAAGEPVTANMQLTYDPTVLNVVGVTPASGNAPSPNSGGVTVDIGTTGVAGAPATPTVVRFRVMARASTSTEVGMEVVGSSRPVQGPPSPHPISIVGR